MRESDIQRAVIDYRNWRMNQDPEWVLLHAIPNGESRDPRTAALLVGQGVTPGVYDLFWPIKTETNLGLYLELKTKVGEPTAEQVLFGIATGIQGYRTCIAYSTDDAIRVLDAYWKMYRPLRSVSVMEECRKYVETIHHRRARQKEKARKRAATKRSKRAHSRP